MAQTDSLIVRGGNFSSCASPFNRHVITLVSPGCTLISCLPCLSRYGLLSLSPCLRNYSSSIRISRVFTEAGSLWAMK